MILLLSETVSRLLGTVSKVFNGLLFVSQANERQIVLKWVG